MTQFALALQQLGTGARPVIECVNGEKFHLAAIMATADVRHDFESEDAGWRYSFDTILDGILVEVVFHTHVEPARLKVVK